MLIEPLRLALPFGGYNGGSIVNPDLSPVEQKLLAPDAARDTVALLEEHGVTSIWVFTGGAWLIRDRAGDYVDLEIHTIQTPPTVVPSLDGHLDAVSKIVGASKDHDRIAAVVAAGQAALRGRASVMRSQAYYCDVTPPGIDKGRLVDLLAERLDRARGTKSRFSATWATTSRCSAAPASRSRWATRRPMSRRWHRQSPYPTTKTDSLSRSSTISSTTDGSRLAGGLRHPLWLSVRSSAYSLWDEPWLKLATHCS